MRRITTTIAWLGISIAAMYVAIVASQTETGWETIASQWRHATLAWLGWPERKISDAEPDAQAEFWLQETERILQATPDSAAMHMGAAWTLDGPALGFMKRHIKPPSPGSPVTRTDPQAFGETLRQANAHFEQRCRAKRLEAAARATKLEPTDVRWWRMRAILLFTADDVIPRTADWDSVLLAGAQHDPDNALYDYLAALHYWKQSASYDPDPDAPNGPWRLQVTDAAQLEKGTERFLRGQTKPYLAIGEAGYPAIADMLAQTSLRKDDQAEVALSRRVTYRHSMLFYQLARWQFWQVEAAHQANDAEQELAMRRRNLRLYDQAIAPAETSALELKMRFAELQPRNYQALRDLHAEHPELLSSAEIAQLSQREQTLSSEAATLRASIAAYHQQREASGFEIVATIASVVTSLACVPLVLSALLAWCLTRRFSAATTEAPPFGWLRYAVAWLGSFVASFVVLGLAPAQVISIAVQKWIALGMLGCLAIAGTGLAAWWIWHFAGRRQVRFSLRAAFVAMTCVAVLAALWPLFEPIVTSILQRPTELWMPARGWDYLDADALRAALKVDVGSWSWAVAQWFAYGGFFVGVGLALFSSTLWYALRIQRHSDHCTHALTKPLLNFVGLSVRRAAWVCLAIYLLMVPTTIQLEEAGFQHKMQYCRDPAAHIDALLAGHTY